MRQRSRHLGLMIAAALLAGNARISSQTPVIVTDHVSATRSLLSGLRWHDEATRGQYVSTRDSLTARTLKAVDAFVADSFQPSAATAAQMSEALKNLLNPGSPRNNSSDAFLIELSGRGRFLITGVDLPRGGPAIAEDAISFRAYRDDALHFIFTAAIDDLHSSDSGAAFLDDLYLKLLSPPPVAGECWFLAAAEVPPHAPPTVAIRLYAFDGNAFRTVWAPKDIQASSSESAIEVTSTGFIVNSLYDPTGRAAGSPTVLRHEQYTLTATGPSRIADWQTDRQ